jgi:Ca-activated chloride channel family protein
MKRKLMYIVIALIAFNLFAGFNLQRIPRWIKGYLDYGKQQYDSSSVNFDRGISGDTDSVMQFNKGTADYKAGNFKAAEESFDKAIKADPDFESAYYNQGNARFRNGNLKGAVESYEQALKLDPNDEDARYNLEFVKKLLENKGSNNSSNETDPNQQGNSQNSSGEESQKKDQNDQQDENLEGPSKDNADSQNPGKGSDSKPSESDEKKGEGGGGNEDSEQPKPQEMDTNKNLSGLTDDEIQSILDALEEQERALSGRLTKRPYGNEDDITDPMSLFEEMWSIQEDLDPFAHIQRKIRQPDEIDW